jgi:pimeloyl-ACP methyl ester carboxylesterase
MGGVFAPLVARDVPVRGIIVYGTIGVPMAQYFHENDARQAPMRGLTGVALERELERGDEFISLFFGERLTPGQIEERAPHLRAFLRLRQADATHLFGRHYTFWHELDNLQLPEPWKHVNAPVLSLWGTADFPASRGDHLVLAQAVNDAGKTQARFVEMPNIGHGFDQAFDMGDSMANGMNGPFNRSIIEVTTEWMREIAPE